MDMRVLLWTILVMTAVMTCTHTLFLPSLFSLLVMGIVPGTSLKIPTGFMLLVYPALCILGMYWLSTLQLFAHDTPVLDRKKTDGRMQPRLAATRPMNTGKRRSQQTI